MTIQAQTIIRRAAERLQDSNSVRWKVGLLVRALNDGQAVLATERPDSVTVIVPTTLELGAKQSLPATASQLMDIAGNSVSKIAVRKVDAALMDAVEPGWQGHAASVTIKHFLYDLRFPRDYYVYPPAAAGAQVDLVYPQYPVAVNEPADGGTYADVTGVLTVSDQWAQPLLDYVLAKAWGVDAEFGGNAALSEKHYGLFEAALGKQIQSAAAVAPTK